MFTTVAQLGNIVNEKAGLPQLDQACGVLHCCYGSSKELAALLQGFGSAGVATYVCFPTGNKDPIVLLNIPTVRLLMDSINEGAV